MSDAAREMSEAEYLAWEEGQEVRHEFDGTRPVAMTGGTVNHELVRMNLTLALASALRGRPCRPFGPTSRMPTTRGRYRYPDVLVTCTPQSGRSRDITDPVVVFEIMSPTTSRSDRGVKLTEYLSIPSLRRYVLLEQDSAMATVISRADDHWRIDVPRGTEAAVPLPEIGIELALSDIYAGVELEPEE
jgi:Uma2 family endonuclease